MNYAYLKILEENGVKVPQEVWHTMDAAMGILAPMTLLIIVVTAGILIKMAVEELRCRRMAGKTKQRGKGHGKPERSFDKRTGR